MALGIALAVRGVQGLLGCPLVRARRVLQFWVTLLHLRAAELSIKPRLDEATLRVTTIDETQLQVYGVYRPRIRATDNSGTTGELHSRLLAASFTGWDIVLGWPWLKDLNPDINWRDECWSYRDDSQEKPMPQGASEGKISF
ncbi:MAG: hypothetical protein M1816_006712 [Peltula sp. TS41687]|nr:MAG: hypothetical protein M1816_006712 [Peltula sp. TS41687]